jgi:hypothetical protein
MGASRIFSGVSPGRIGDKSEPFALIEMVVPECWRSFWMALAESRCFYEFCFSFLLKNVLMTKASTITGFIEYISCEQRG